MTSFNILYSDDGKIFSYVEEGGGPKVFRGSYDPTTPIEIKLAQPIETRFIRIAPKTWQGSAIALKFDVFTCFNATQQQLEEEKLEEETFFGGEALFLRPTSMTPDTDMGYLAIQLRDSRIVFSFKLGSAGEIVEIQSEPVELETWVHVHAER